MGICIGTCYPGFSPAFFVLKKRWLLGCTYRCAALLKLIQAVEFLKQTRRTGEVADIGWEIADGGEFICRNIPVLKT
jgi:hypothetical protein